ncbi:asparagine synthase (glutamine-hydrolyzing) [Variovorax guangxiensis]|uniref:asparagine synthase (glutamine-hydrolyzing) n=1 Tax=Variovorax guangxiensis TaxID=1775474 RepID=A0A502DMR5_9BURK|nr:asparagine synthase (glutamine-hydrolyzing) [Variovorax guangxiensis]TPG20634.1 asparagine synthase (glutamine-hydrolyzing) [Variovorax ginsengisoli]TPG25779.1 asparagine synthase (glutamine-hydrolyzing) [Variovorax guangxiensis]
MCGFTGFLGGALFGDRPFAMALLQRMADTLAARGPDDSGLWHEVAGASAIGLAHRRLAILDLSPAGHQPMVCHTGRYVIAFNGEIYNHLDVRKELQAGGHAPSWRGRSDTETLLAGFVAWGVTATLQRSIGMFAFALWDKREELLILGRDRMGEKPLYYGWQGAGEESSFLFGSELKALKEHPGFKSEIDRDALSLLMRHNYINAPHSIYRGIYKLLPGHVLSVSMRKREPVLEQFWSLTDVAQAGVRRPFTGGVESITDELETLLRSAVRQQMLSDVPLGAFLSGGVDSSTVVALMQAQSDRPVKTFTIGFHEKGYNEAVHAKAVAKHLGTEHTELYVTAQQALDVIPKLPGLYCEPFADSSQIPTFLVSLLARQKVTVALSGDAGDELFCGYSRYVVARDLWAKAGRIPRSLRGAAAVGIRALSADGWNALLAPVRSFLPISLRDANVGDKLHKGAALLSARQVDELYLKLVSHWEPDGLVLSSHEPFTALRGAPPTLAGLNELERMMALDAITYLPGDILTKVDRAAMGVSLEGRVPFLDHRVVEFAWRVPQAMKLRAGMGKWILRQVLYRHVPRSLIERPKMGFGVPIGSWLRGPLRDWAEDLLDECRLKNEGYFNPIPIRKKWTEHLSGQRNWEQQLWCVLMFQGWLDEHTKQVRL